MKEYSTPKRYEGLMVLDRPMIRDGLAFLLGKSPADLKGSLDIDTLTDYYAEQYCGRSLNEDSTESTIYTSEQLKTFFVDIYGHLSPFNMVPGLEEDLYVSDMHSSLDNLLVMQTGVEPIRAIRMSILSDEEFNSLVETMPVSIIGIYYSYLWMGNNRSLQAYLRGRESIPSKRIQIKRPWRDNIRLNFLSQTQHIIDTLGGASIAALHRSVYTRMMNEINEAR